MTRSTRLFILHPALLAGFLFLWFDVPILEACMMSYEAAKEWKEEGYPQIIRPGVMFYTASGEPHMSKIFTANPAEFGLGEIVVVPAGKEMAEWLALDSDYGSLPPSDREEGG